MAGPSMNSTALDEASTPACLLRHKRLASVAFPQSTRSPGSSHSMFSSRSGRRRGPQVGLSQDVTCEAAEVALPHASDANSVGVNRPDEDSATAGAEAAPEAGARTGATTPWDLGGASAREKGGGEGDASEREGGAQIKMAQQLLLDEEIDECLKEIKELRRLLMAVISTTKGDPLLSGEVVGGSAQISGDLADGLKSEGVFTTMRVFRLDQLSGEIAEPPASAMAGVLRGTKRVVAALADRIHSIENSASVWLTHGAEVLPYLQHLQQSLEDLQRQEQQTAQKTNEVMARVAQKRQQEEVVRFRLEKTQDEFRLARLDLTREELEKISGKERMQLLESRQEALDRELKSLAAFSPLFIVERAAKYIALQYRPEQSSVDHEICIEGLDLSFTRGATRISPFFSVHVQPPNDRVRLLLESGIRELLQKLSTNQGALQRRGRGAEDLNFRGVDAADDIVVEHIAAVLIKTLSSSFSTTNVPPRYLPLKEVVQAVET
ncbi:non-muscle myosin heavy [Cyclospora cayetanensis]|uniref:Non-muscle myosin heavy n=1 Tax=Cyclospora cayetanensis TaxID=88456 RepID=A0A1D3D9M8_9EIME|nr:non-muscle myosin heavy [Cyclospora cayetanensis]